MRGKLKGHFFISEKKLNDLIEEKAEEIIREQNSKYEYELLLRQANLETLQSQINPHFLYNTLEVIRGMALLADQDNIADIAYSLSNFFRYSISGKSDVVTLKEEIENAENYCRIQKYRFGNRFKLEINADDRAADVLIPKMTLQPIIENAIIHGLADYTEGGKIWISTKQTGQNVHIAVKDNGSGMELEQLTALQNKICGESEIFMPSSKHTGIGIQNVDRRIKLYFGREFGVNIYSCPLLGTEVEILIPFGSVHSKDEENG